MALYIRGNGKAISITDKVQEFGQMAPFMKVNGKMIPKQEWEPKSLKMDPYSPKSSPRGSATSNPMESGGNPLKLSIALGPGGQKPTIIQKGPFYLMKPDALPRSEITGATNLMASKGLEHSYIKLTSKYI